MSDIRGDDYAFINDENFSRKEFLLTPLRWNEGVLEQKWEIRRFDHKTHSERTYHEWRPVPTR